MTGARAAAVVIAGAAALVAAGGGCGRLKPDRAALEDAGVAGAPDAPADARDAPADAGAGTARDLGVDRSFVAAIPAFPGAEGFGRFAKGGRGGSVCHVTTLADAGPGSFRACVGVANRTVVFDVGGWITLATPIVTIANNLTVAGQTAPGGGIGIRGQRVSFGGRGVVVRFMRFRRGTVVNATRDDSLIVMSSADTIIIDHCSVGFAIDENFSMPGDEPVGPHDLTVQWTIVGYALQAVNHSAGSLLMADDTTIHHTLWALNKTRNPRARTTAAGVLDWVNNVTYGWDARHPFGEMMGWSLSSDPFMLANSGTGTHRANAVGNTFVSTRAAPYAFVAGAANAAGVPAFSLYFADNLLDGNANGVLDASKTDWTMVQQPAAALSERLPAPAVETDAAAAGYERVLAHAGATVPRRDEVDALLVAHVRAQTGLLITTEGDLVTEGITNGGYGTLEPGTPPADGDGDGMPDMWEVARGLDPADATDGNGDADGDGYTNLEDYLASLVPPNSI